MSINIDKPLEIADVTLQILEASSDSCAVIDVGLRYVYANKAFLERYGQPLDAVVGKTPAHVVGEANFETVLKPRMTACLAGEAVEYEAEFHIPALGNRWISARYEPLRDDSGAVVALVSFTRDITREKEDHQIRETLERERFLISQVEDVMGVGVFVWDVASQRNIYCSESLGHIHGMTPEDIEKGIDGEDADVALAIPEDRPHVAVAYENSRLYGTPLDVEYRIEHPEKGRRWIHEVAVRRTLGEDKRVVTMGTIQDITERKKGEEELEIQRLLAGQAEKLANLGYWMWDMDAMHSVYFSDQCATIHGLSREEFEKMQSSPEADLARINREDRDRVEAATLRARSGEEPFDEQYRITRPDGDVRWIHEVGVMRKESMGIRNLSIGILQDETEHKRIEEELATQRMIAEQAENIGKIGYWLWDMVADRSLYFSDQAAAIHGLTREEFSKTQSSAKLDLERVHPDDYDRIRAAVYHTKETGEPFDEEYRINHADGSIRWVHERGMPHTVVDGKTTVLLGTLQDITERRGREETLRQRDIIYRQIEDHIAIGYWTWDEKNYGPTFFSDGLPKIYGMTREEYIESHSSIEAEISVAHPDDRDRVEQALRRFQDTGESYDLEYRILCADGSARWVHEASAVLRSSETGKPEASIGTVRDITARKLGEEDLRRREAMFRQIDENFDIGFWTWQAEPYGMDYVSDAYARIFGRTRDELIAQSTSLENDLAVIHPDDRERMRDAYLTLNAKSIPYDEEYRITRSDGAIRWVHEITAPLRVNDDGSLQSDIGILHDVTERRERENELRQARDAAEHASRAKTDFLAHMSHELRTPLNAVLGFSDAIRTEIFGPLGDGRYKEYMDNIQNSGRLLLALINDLLDMAAIEAGELSVDLEPQDIGALVSEMVEIAGPTARLKNIAITRDGGLKGLTLMVDARRFRQIVLNLLINAVKYTPAGGAVDIFAGFDKLGQPTVSIRDNGVGMTEDEVEAALIPFKRVGNATIRQIEGTGIGLPLTKQLVELHRGTLTIESEKGKGTTVVITLPVERIVP